MLFLSRSIDSAEESLWLFFFAVAFNFVKSFILVWHSDYKWPTKTQKPFFILKESLLWNDINYKLKSCCNVLFWFAIDRATSTRTRPSSTPSKVGCWSKIFLKLLNLSSTKIRRPRAQFLPKQTSQPVNNIYVRIKLYFLPVQDYFW